MKNKKIMFCISLILMLFVNVLGSVFTVNTEYTSKQTEQTQKTQTKHRKCRKVRAKLTAYCPCRQCSEGWGYSTASGRRAKAGRTIAVDRRKIKLGTKVKIGSKTYTAEDVGGGVRGYHIDIFMKNHRQTQRFGIKYKTIFIY